MNETPTVREIKAQLTQKMTSLGFIENVESISRSCEKHPAANRKHRKEEEVDFLFSSILEIIQRCRRTEKPSGKLHFNLLYCFSNFYSI
jgi:hypothetical protein